MCPWVLFGWPHVSFSQVSSVTPCVVAVSSECGYILLTSFIDLLINTWFILILHRLGKEKILFSIPTPVSVLPHCFVPTATLTQTHNQVVDVNFGNKQQLARSKMKWQTSLFVNQTCYLQYFFLTEDTTRQLLLHLEFSQARFPVWNQLYYERNAEFVLVTHC